jgi:hypothetical protein
MTKVAALGAPALLGIGLSVAGSLVNMAAQRSHQKKQDQANRDWMAYQNQKSRQFDKRDAESRRQAQAELNENLDSSGLDARQNVIDEETSRLSDAFGASDENIANVTANLVGSGQGGGQSKVFDAEMARQLGNASSEAKKRIQAMAHSTAYGGGSMGGMGVTDMVRNMNTGANLGGINDTRRGNIDILRRYQTVEPEILQYRGSPLGSALGAVGGALAGGMGSGTTLGSLASTAGAAGDPWSGLRAATPSASYFAPGGGWGQGGSPIGPR